MSTVCRHCLLMSTCLLMLTYVYLCRHMSTFADICILMSTYVYLCRHRSTYVNICPLMSTVFRYWLSTYVDICLLMSTVCRYWLSTYVDICLMSTYVYLCRHMCTYVDFTLYKMISFDILVLNYYWCDYRLTLRWIKRALISFLNHIFLTICCVVAYQS